MCLNVLFLSAIWLCSCALAWAQDSPRNATYQTFTLASVCPQLRPDALRLSENDVHQPATPPRKTINLGLGVAALLDERLNLSTALRPSHPVDCTFEVATGAESRGLFVVLSQLNALRRFPNGSCQDYLRLNYANFYSAAICGPIGQRGAPILAYDSNIRVVMVQLHLDGATPPQPLQLRLKLVLTSYFDCERERDGFSCPGTNERCIPREYVRDGIVNCDVPNCRDEGSCTAANADDADGGLSGGDNLSVTILIGLVSFVSTGLVFGLLLWLCLKRNFKQRLGGSSPTLDMELTTNVYETEEAATSSSARGGRRRGGRSANSNEGVAGGSGVNESAAASGTTATTPGSADLPPSYDVLFPGK